MAPSSSTFSSKLKLPRGALWAGAFFLLAEGAFRLVPTSFFLAIDQHDYQEVGIADYQAVSLALELMRAPDVVVMGTSRAREAIQSPVFERLLQRSGREGKLVARNYAIAGGRIDTSLALLRRMIAGHHSLPKVIVLGVDGSDFRDAVPSVDSYRVTTLGTLVEDLRSSGLPTEAEIGYAIGNSLPLRMVDARPTLRYRLIRRGERRGREAMADNSAFGGTSGWARDYAELLPNRNRPPKMKSSRSQALRVARAYAIQSGQLAKLGSFVRLATAYGVRVVLAELPVAPPVLELKQVSEVRGELRAALQRWNKHSCVRVVTLEGRDADYGLREFRDDSHLSARGAARFAILIAPSTAELMAEPGTCKSTR